MSATIARMLRLFAVLTLLVGGAAGHNTAMAEGLMEPIHGVLTQSQDFEDASASCNGSSCEESASCCLQGQCFMGVPAQEGDDWPTRRPPQQNAASALVLAGSFPMLPYRPPAAV